MNKSIKEMALSLFTETAKFAAAGFKVTPVEVLEERMSICHECSCFDKKWFAGTGRCNECNCSIQAKLRMATTSCPINKWAAVTPNDDK